MSNPFDEDTDDNYFKKPANTNASSNFYSSNSSSYTYTKPSPEGGETEEWNFYERQIEDAMQSSLASTQRSMKALEESETVGVATAEDLLVQGEKLRGVDKRLDEINSTTGQTQRHLNNIKSVFGGIKNYFSKAPKDAPASKLHQQSPKKLENTVEKLKADTSGFYSEETSKSATYNTGGKTLSDQSRSAIQGTRWGAMDDEIEENLDQMSSNLRRLRHLGTALGSEMDDQNELLDRLSTKTDKTNVTVRDQDRQMKRILGQEPKKTTKKSDEQDTYKNLLQ